MENKWDISVKHEKDCKETITIAPYKSEVRIATSILFKGNTKDTSARYKKVNPDRTKGKNTLKRDHSYDMVSRTRIGVR